MHHRLTSQLLPQHVEWIVGLKGALAIRVLDRDLIASRRDRSIRVERHEAVASHLLASDHAFKQPCRSASVESLEGGHGSQTVGDQRPTNRYQPMSLSEFLKACKVTRRNHRRLQTELKSARR